MNRGSLNSGTLGVGTGTNLSLFSARQVLRLVGSLHTNAKLHARVSQRMALDATLSAKRKTSVALATVMRLEPSLVAGAWRRVAIAAIQRFRLTTQATSTRTAHVRERLSLALESAARAAVTRGAKATQPMRLVAGFTARTAQRAVLATTLRLSGANGGYVLRYSPVKIAQPMRLVAQDGVRVWRYRPASAMQPMQLIGSLTAYDLSLSRAPEERRAYVAAMDRRAYVTANYNTAEV